MISYLRMLFAMLKLVVLILTVVDNGLVLGAKVDAVQQERSVLILFVVDDGLVRYYYEKE